MPWPTTWPHDGWEFAALCVVAGTGLIFLLVRRAEDRQNSVDANLSDLAKGGNVIRARLLKIIGAIEGMAARLHDIDTRLGGVERHVNEIRRDVDEMRDHHPRLFRRPRR